MSLPLRQLCSECQNRNTCNNYIDSERRTNLTLQDFKTMKENFADNNFDPAVDGNIRCGDSIEIELNGKKTKWIVEYISCNFIEDYLNAANDAVKLHSVSIER